MWVSWRNSATQMASCCLALGFAVTYIFAAPTPCFLVVMHAQHTACYAGNNKAPIRDWPDVANTTTTVAYDGGLQGGWQVRAQLPN